MINMQHLTDFSRSSQITLCRFELDAAVDEYRHDGTFDRGVTGTANNTCTPPVNQSHTSPETKQDLSYFLQNKADSDKV